MRTSNGTEDYFKYDPNPASPHNRPIITFTIEDEGEPRVYDAYILMWPTSNTPNNLFGSLNYLFYDYQMPWIENWNLETGSFSMTWDGSEIPQGWAGHNPDSGIRSTYGFEIIVYKFMDEYANYDEYIDWFYYKWPYCLHIGEHDVSRTVSPIEGDSLYVSYFVHDHAEIDELPYSEDRTIQLIPFDEGLRELSSPVVGPSELNTLHDGEDGLGIFVYQGHDLAGKCRVVFTGEDNCWREYRRDHNGCRILATNNRAPIDFIIVLIPGVYPQIFWKYELTMPHNTGEMEGRGYLYDSDNKLIDKIHYIADMNTSVVQCMCCENGTNMHANFRIPTEGKCILNTPRKDYPRLNIYLHREYREPYNKFADQWEKEYGRRPKAQEETFMTRFFSFLAASGSNPGTPLATAVLEQYVRGVGPAVKILECVGALMTINGAALDLYKIEQKILRGAALANPGALFDDKADPTLDIVRQYIETFGNARDSTVRWVSSDHRHGQWGFWLFQ